MIMPLVETERLIVRNFKSSDWEALRHIIIQYQASEYAAYDHQWPTSEGEIKKITEWFASGDSYWAVELKDQGQLIGFVSLQREQNDQQTANLGYVFDFDHHQQGFATEACQAAIKHMFDSGQTKQIITGTAAVNISSCRLLERLGFQKTSESMTSFSSTNEDHPVTFLGRTYELSKEAWDAANGQAVH
jgi:RimJ/RimL family protein N-acetyltransferase